MHLLFLGILRALYDAFKKLLTSYSHKDPYHTFANNYLIQIASMVSRSPFVRRIS